MVITMATIMPNGSYLHTVYSVQCTCTVCTCTCIYYSTCIMQYMYNLHYTVYTGVLVQCTMYMVLVIHILYVYMYIIIMYII